MSKRRECTTKKAPRAFETLSALALSLLLTSNALAASATRTSSFEYDPASGLLTKEVIEPGDSTLCLVTSYTYDAYGNKTGATTRNCNGSSGEAPPPSGIAVFDSRTSSSEFAAGWVVIDGLSYTWAAGQFPTTGTNAVGHSEGRKFDPRSGAVAELTGPNGLTTSWSYDSFGRRTLEVRADGTRTQWTYVLCAAVGGTGSCPSLASYFVQTTPQDAAGAQNGPVTRVYYDSLNREIRTETQGFEGTPVYKDTQYDALGRVAQSSRPYYAGEAAPWTVFQYDILGRVVIATEPATPAGAVRTGTEYNGLTTTVTLSNDGTGNGLPNGQLQSKSTFRNSQGQTVAVTDALVNRVAYTYDLFGNLLTTDAGGITTALEYDARGRKTQMTDPDMGVWSYRYNALGELVWQCDPVARALASTGNPADCTDAVATRMAYDRLGRMVSRTERDLTNTWYYDQDQAGADCPYGKGKLCEVDSTGSAAGGGYHRKYAFDDKGRLAQRVTTVEATLYPIGYTYNAGNGQLESTTYPSGFVAKNGYNSLGYLEKVTDAAGATTFWQATSVSASGKILTQTLGNELTTTRGYDVLDRMLSNVVGPGGNIVQTGYTYDTIGNLIERQAVVPNAITESFAYDELNRLTSVSGPGLPPRSYTYTALGNIGAKSDVGNYTYLAAGNTRPHAVSSVTGNNAPNTITASYDYDANGNLTAASGTIYPATGSPVAFSRTLAYTSFNLPASLTQTQASSTYSYAYTYNADHERVKLVTVNLAGTFTTVYLHPAGRGQLLYERETKEGSSQVEHKNFIQAGAILVGVYITRDSPESGNPATEMRYFHTDHLGSVVAITNEAGAALERFAYESYGERRHLDGSAQDRVSPEIGLYTDRGFTGHEHLDEMNLIHMNGRIYDPALARFMTADPFLQSPDNLQNYNRYSYVLNNPLAFTDPAGYFKIPKALRVAAAIGAAVFVPQLLTNVFLESAAIAAVGSNALAATTAFAAANAAWVEGTLTGLGAFVAGAGGGFAAGLIATGDLESGLKGALTGGLFGAVGFNTIASTPESYLGHAGVGCLSGVLNGGGCGRGAASELVGKFATNATGSSDWSNEARFVAATVAGGTISVIAGGNFQNGAVTAAFGYLFNHLISIGLSGRLPLLGGGSAAFGFSWHEEKFDAGFVLQGDIPSLNPGRMLGGFRFIELGYQPGDFDTIRGTTDLQLQGQWGTWGGSVSTGPGGGFSGLTVNLIGVGYGGSASLVKVEYHLRWADI